MARADAGIDFDGTGYAFLESPAFLAAVLALAVAAYAAERVRARRRGDPSERSPRAEGAPWRDPVTLAVVALALVLGALLFAGSLAAGGSEAWPGLAAGVACALLGAGAAVGLLDRARRRLDASAAALLPVWADAAALALAAASIAYPPVAPLGLIALAYLLLASRRAGASKYEGLRILR